MELNFKNEQLARAAKSIETIDINLDQYEFTADQKAEINADIAAICEQVKALTRKMNHILDEH